jgi:hypothetical protein
MRNRRRHNEECEVQEDEDGRRHRLDGGLVTDGPHGLRSVVLAGDGVGFGGEDRLAAEVDALYRS